MPYSFEPIGFVVSPLRERAEAPRQPGLDPASGKAGGLPGGSGVAGRIELTSGRGFEDALSGLEGWQYAWVLFVFHRNVEEGRGWKPKVLPPRAEEKHGVFATRSPHRPNPIGMSAVRIERIEGLVVHVRELDILDGTPVLDLKPYVPYADSRPDARSGWLEARDPLPAWSVDFTEEADEQLSFLLARGVDLRAGIVRSLSRASAPRVPPHPSARRANASGPEGLACRVRRRG